MRLCKHKLGPDLPVPVENTLCTHIRRRAREYTPNSSCGERNDDGVDAVGHDSFDASRVLFFHEEEEQKMGTHRRHDRLL